MIFSHHLLFNLYCAQHCEMVMWRLLVRFIGLLKFCNTLSSSVISQLLGWPPVDRLFWCANIFKLLTMIHVSVFEPEKIFSECQFLMWVLINMKSSNYLSFFSSTSFAFIADNWPWSLILSNSLVKCEFFFQLTRHGRLNFVQTISSIVALISKPHTLLDLVVEIVKLSIFWET